MSSEFEQSKQPQRCRQCGSRLPFTASGRVACPVCLMKLGLESCVDSASEAAANEGPTDTTANDGGFSAPEIAQLQPHFPQFRFTRLLGKGGMGAVYEAKQTTLDRTVAVKIIHPSAAADKNFAERFQREARSLAKLSHPSIVTIHDFGEVTFQDESGEARSVCFIVMEHVDGANLRELMRAKELTPAKALRIIPAICDALQYAHDSGVVHRDIKPENILVDRSGRVKIADFGLVKLIGREQNDRTLTGEYQAMGTLHYMAPEQFEKPLQVDHRADIYALGVTLYELLTGELPLGRFLPPSQRVQVDVRLDEIVLKSMDHDPCRRYQHASEVKSDVEHVSATPATQLNSQAVPTTRRTSCSRWFVAAWLGMPSFLRLLVHTVLTFGMLFCLMQFLGFHLDPSKGEVHFRFGGPHPWMTIDMTPMSSSIQWHLTLSALAGLAAFGLFKLDRWLTIIEGKSYPSEVWFGFGISLSYFWFLGISSMGLGNNAKLAPEGSSLSTLHLGAQAMARLISAIGFFTMIGCLVRIAWEAEQNSIAENGKANARKLFNSKEGVIAITIAVLSSLAILLFVVSNKRSLQAIERNRADRQMMLLGDWTRTNDADLGSVHTLRFMESGEFHQTGRMEMSLGGGPKIAVTKEFDGGDISDLVPIRYVGWWKLKGEHLVTQFTSSTDDGFSEESPGGPREFEIKELTPHKLSLTMIVDDKNGGDRWTFFRSEEHQPDGSL